jgi:hypothetical protein
MPLYTRAAEQTLDAVKRNPWIVAVPMVALGLGSLVDWLLAPLLNLGLIIAAPLKGLLWSVVLHVWRRTLLERDVDRSELEAELVARAKSLRALWVPLLFGTLAFLTLAWGGPLASVFVLVLVLTPMLEAVLLGSQSGLSAFFRLHGRAWAVSQLVFTSVLFALWLAAVMVAASLHLLVGEVISAVVGGPLLAVLWLIRGHAWVLVDEGELTPARRPNSKKAPPKESRFSKKV